MFVEVRVERGNGGGHKFIERESRGGELVHVVRSGRNILRRIHDNGGDDESSSSSSPKI